MQVKVGHGVSGIVAHVEHEAIARLEFLGIGHFVRQHEHIRQDLRMLGTQGRRVLDMAPRND